MIYIFHQIPQLGLIRRENSGVKMRENSDNLINVLNEVIALFAEVSKDVVKKCLILGKRN